jgi:hypothetical protein
MRRLVLPRESLCLQRTPSRTKTMARAAGGWTAYRQARGNVVNQRSRPVRDE